MKIQFIIVGWHFAHKEWNENLKELNDANDNINVFWSCHQEPTDYIKENFDHKVFFNAAEECGAYQQAIDYLDLEDDTVCFFIHDDMIVKDWGFIQICINYLEQGYKVGNGRDYNDTIDPMKVCNKGIGISEEFDGATLKDYVKPENKHLFDRPLNIVKVRHSFMCMKYKDVKAMGGFEPCKEAYIPPLFKKDEWCENDEPHYRGSKGLSSFGNIFPALNCYKMNKVFGHQKIAWLSQTYVDSKYLYECQRGGMSDKHPMS
jgi:hypothetical protein